MASKQKAIIFDMDGTLVDVSEIRYLVERSDPRFIRREFDLFHRMSEFMPAHNLVLDAVKWARFNGYAIMIVTARTYKYEGVTRAWLGRHKVSFTHLYMRGDDDFRPDGEVKQDILNIIRERYDVVHAYDDNPAVVEVWRRNGIETTVVPGWPADAVQRQAGEA